MEWQPIETAPRDGTHILVFNAPFGEVWQVSRRADQWVCVDDEVLGDDNQVTHWMPLPEPPQ